VDRATLTQVRAGRGRRLIEIDSDVMDVCSRIREIDSSLGVDYSEDGAYFRIFQLGQDDRKRTVTTALELTPEVVEEVRRIARPDYDLAGELDRLDDQADRENQHRFHEQAGEVGEQLYHAMRKDLHVQDRIFLRRGVDGNVR
jgi:hypothetical protein